MEEPPRERKRRASPLKSQLGKGDRLYMHSCSSCISVHSSSFPFIYTSPYIPCPSNFQTVHSSIVSLLILGAPRPVVLVTMNGLSSWIFFYITIILLVSSVLSQEQYVIVYDNFGNLVGFPLTGGNATGGFTVNNAESDTSVYILSVNISNPVLSGHSSACQGQFYISDGFYQAGLTSSYYYTDGSDPVVGSPPNYYLGNATNMWNIAGIYTFNFTIPQGGYLQLYMLYQSLVNPAVNDHIYVLVYNPIKVISPSAPLASLPFSSQIIAYYPFDIDLRNLQDPQGLYGNLSSNPTGFLSTTYQLNRFGGGSLYMAPNNYSTTVTVFGIGVINDTNNDTELIGPTELPSAIPSGWTISVWVYPISYRV